MPERTCVCCRKKEEKKNLIRISQINEKYIFDEKMKIQNRGFYICGNAICVEKLSKHKKYNIELTELMKIMKKIENRKKNILDIIKPMKNSKFFVFGVEDNLDLMKKSKVKLIILPKDIKEKYITEFKKISEENKISIIFIKNKKSLLEIFDRDVNVIGIYDKKVVRGILNKVEVTDEDIRFR